MVNMVGSTAPRCARMRLPLSLEPWRSLAVNAGEGHTSVSIDSDADARGRRNLIDVGVIFAVAIDVAPGLSPVTAALPRKTSARHQSVARSVRRNWSKRLAATTAAADMLSDVESRTKARVFARGRKDNAPDDHRPGECAR